MAYDWQGFSNLPTHHHHFPVFNLRGCKKVHIAPIGEAEFVAYLIGIVREIAAGNVGFPASDMGLNGLSVVLANLLDYKTSGRQTGAKLGGSVQMCVGVEFCQPKLLGKGAKCPGF